jgi:cell filamentation protein
MANFGKDALRRHTPCREGRDVPVERSLAEVHAQLILIHPFRDGNARLARLVSVLMVSQAGLNPLRLSAVAGSGRRTYVQAIHAAKSGDYTPLETLFASALDSPWRRAAFTV